MLDKTTWMFVVLKVKPWIMSAVLPFCRSIMWRIQLRQLVNASWFRNGCFILKQSCGRIKHTVQFIINKLISIHEYKLSTNSGKRRIQRKEDFLCSKNLIYHLSHPERLSMNKNLKKRYKIGTVNIWNVLMLCYRGIYNTYNI